MRILIGYESMYGNTHQIAEAIGSGFDPGDEVVVAHIGELAAELAHADVLVVGAPTHAHGLPRPNSRRAAVDGAQKSNDSHDLDPSATAASGVREWIANLPATLPRHVAAFDTRFNLPGWVAGHPARHVSRTLARHGAVVVAAPESFFVDKTEHLRDGELERARAWGAQIRTRVAGALVGAAGS